MNLFLPARFEAGYFDTLVSREERGRARVLPVRIWYPAQSAGTQAMPVLADGATAACLAEWQGVPALIGLREKRIETCTHNAPPAEGRFPLLLFSHGYTLFATQNAMQCEALARQGYIVAAISHTGDCIEAVLPERTERLDPARMNAVMEEGQKILARFGDIYNADIDSIRQYCAESINGRYCPVWKDDAVSVIDALSQSSFVLAQRVEKDKIGYFGMSFGGCSAFYTPHFESRIKAAVNLDGALFGGQREMKPVDIPLLLCGQRADLLRDSGINPAQKLTCILFEDALHGDFTNLPLWMERLRAGDSPLTGKVNKPRMQEALTLLLIDFFDRHLKGEESRLCKIAGSYADVMRAL